MDISKIIALGKAVAQLDPRAAGVVAAVEAAVDVVKDIRTTVSMPENQIAELDEARAELESRVNAHADRTAQTLAD